MDAVKFVDAYIRMCSQGWDCEDCPLYQSDEIDICTAMPQKRSRESALRSKDGRRCWQWMLGKS